MTPNWWLGPPPHERGLSRREQEARDSADPNYDYCLVRKNYDLPTQQVWFTAQQGQTMIGRSRVLAKKGGLFGNLKRFDRETDAAHDAFVQTLLDNGWEPVGSYQPGSAQVFRRPKEHPSAKAQR